MRALLLDLHSVIAQQHGHALVALGTRHIDAVVAGLEDRGLDRVEPQAFVINAHLGGLFAKPQRVGSNVVEVLEDHPVDVRAHARLGAHAAAFIHIEVDALVQPSVA